MSLENSYRFKIVAKHGGHILAYSLDDGVILASYVGAKRTKSHSGSIECILQKTVRNKLHQSHSRCVSGEPEQRLKW